MRHTYLERLLVVGASLWLTACDPVSTRVTLDDFSAVDTDAQYSVGDVIQLSVGATALDGDTTVGTVEVYRSEDADITFSDSHLGTYSILDVSTTSVATATLSVATGGWEPGEYVLAACEVHVNTTPSEQCETLSVTVLASSTLIGLVPDALLVDRDIIIADANGEELIAMGQVLEFDDDATDDYSVAIYLSESVVHDDSTVQVGFYTVANGTTPWRVDLDASSWNANVDLYLSACWANGGLANNLTDCYHLAHPVAVIR